MSYDVADYDTDELGPFLEDEADYFNPEWFADSHEDRN